MPARARAGPDQTQEAGNQPGSPTRIAAQPGESSLLPPTVHVSKKLESDAEPGLKFKDSD